MSEVLKDPKVFENIFCLGDACLTSANEEKSVTPLKQCVDICFNNILNVATSRGKLKSIPRVFPGLYSISLGPEEGIIVVNNYVHVGPKAALTKREIEENYMGSLKGDERSKEVLQKKNEQIQQMFVVATLSVAVVHALLSKEEDQGEAKKEFQIPER
eukprot:CAMPEP_0170552598 /NCGR_PEP_ID=MMETSP0211-20121228/10475_1 /TAXON_ID=311385 /ORGANISM="Pseudokeronopsis sp., Strain OXSARD2" /LENGTH=157 /DNA_ID=CAMNT_0010860415 /DNA_START=843 /DNA_END=1313 /DNA_ORIENTATION=-